MTDIDYKSNYLRQQGFGYIEWYEQQELDRIGHVLIEKAIDFPYRFEVEQLPEHDFPFHFSDGQMHTASYRAISEILRLEKILKPWSSARSYSVDGAKLIFMFSDETDRVFFEFIWAVMNYG